MTRARVPYSVIQHLALGNWLHHDPDRCYMAMFHTYHDTSGSAKDSPTLVTTGLIASEASWRRFERAWREMLERFCIPYIHMSELAPGNSPFLHIEENPEDKKRLIRCMVRIVSKHTFPVFASLDVGAFNSLDEEYGMTEYFGGPFSSCAAVAVKAGDRWLSETHSGYKVMHYHERGEKGSDGVGKLMRLLEAEDIELQPLRKKAKSTGEWLIPFQACDFIAWEIRRAAKDLHLKRDLRGSFNLITEWFGSRRIWHALGREQMLETVKKHGIIKRAKK